jgi:hypothetical protein
VRNENLHLLDRPATHRYKAALFLAVTVLFASVPALAKELVVRGAILPAGSQQVGEERYRSPSNYADTLTYYSKIYRANPRKTIVNQPGIRAVHIVNDGKGEWDGLNIYELGGETRIFVVVRDAPKSGEKAGKTDK